MTEHGAQSPDGKNWFCGYWMDQEEWDSVHDYSPPALSQVNEQTGSNEAGQIDEDSEG